jgi:hypothetical protein
MNQPDDPEEKAALARTLEVLDAEIARTKKELDELNQREKRRHDPN